ncbi:MAG TPA: M24 family metallopeptidase [Acidobacteriota bacterium]|nr:M24 family metallopeptidase [Acidobacteriota bacterium]HQM64635.1 M24 family metallopeptidase [Acidobacteriota bacterium]
MTRPVTAVVGTALALGILGIVLAAGVDPSTATADPGAALPTLREQAALRQEWLRLRLERHLPAVMRRAGAPMWLVIAGEYNEDPVFFSLVAPTELSAHRRSILVFCDRGEAGVERRVIGGSDSGGLYQPYRDPELARQVSRDRLAWELLRRLVEERQPASIAVNISTGTALADGLSAGDRELLETALGPSWSARLVRNDNLAVEYLSLRLPEMLPFYRRLMGIAHHLIGRAFSAEVIVPGQTTTTDVVWWLRQEAARLGCGVWFHPTVDVQRRGLGGGFKPPDDTETVIEPGDVIHVDLGLTAAGLATDTQHMGYVLRPGETDAPAGLKQALAVGNRLQDIVCAAMRPGRTGNEALAAALAAMRAEGIQGAVYSHPVGDHGHGAGPVIGLWDRQEAVPVRGDRAIRADTWWAVELYAAPPVPEWDGQEVRMMLEEDAVLTATGTQWVLPRQEKFHLVGKR